MAARELEEGPVPIRGRGAPAAGPPKHRREPVYGVPLVKSRSASHVGSMRSTTLSQQRGSLAKHRRADEVNLPRGSAPPRPTPAARAVPAVGEDLAGSTRVLGGAGRPGHFIVADEGFEGPFGHCVGRGWVIVGPARARVPDVARL